MANNSANILSGSLISHLAYIEKTRKKSEDLLLTGTLTNRDVNVIYSGLFLEAVVSFERFLENLFTDLLTKKVIHPSSKVKPKSFFKSSRIARDVLLGERIYLDWLPYNRYTTKRAKRFFNNGLPFIDLDSLFGSGTDKKVDNMTERISIIRNAIAHKSDHSIETFEKKVISSAVALHSKEKNPIGYLRGLHSSHPKRTTRYEQIINEIKYISVLLTSK